MQDFFLGEMEHPNPVTGYYIERFWPVIFNPDEYCLWDPNEKADTELNEQGQLAKGHWHEMPKWVDSDLTIVDPRDPNRKVI